MDPMRTPDDRLPQHVPMQHVPMQHVPISYGPTPYERIGDLERSRTCDELSAHFAAGRLAPVELDARLAAAVEAVTIHDLHAVTRDLPRLAAPTPAHPGPLARPSGWTGVDLLVLLLLIGSALMAGGMLLMLGAYDVALFVAAGFGGTAAFAGGAAMVHLAHRRAAQRPRIA